MQEIFLRRERGEGEVLSIFDEDLNNIMLEGKYRIFSMFGKKFNEKEIFLMERNISHDKELKQKEIMQKIAILRNVNQDDIQITEFDPISNPFGFIDDEIYFNNIIDDENYLLENPLSVDSLSDEERYEIVDLLKKQNTIICENFRVNNSLYGLLFAINFDLIVKVSKDNEMEYFDELMKKNSCSLNDVVRIFLFKYVNLDKNINKKIIEQYTEYGGIENILSLYNEYKIKGDDDSRSDHKTGFNNFDEILGRNLMGVLNVIQNKYKNFFNENDDVVQIIDDDIVINKERFSIECKDDIAESVFEYIHKQIEELHNATLYVSINKEKIFVKHGDLIDIKNTYLNFIEETIEKNKEEGFVLNISKMDVLLRSAYLKSVTLDKDSSDRKTQFRKKI